MLLSKIDSDKLNDEQIAKIVFDLPLDDGLPGDCIFVFGSSFYIDERVNLAVKLYKKNRAPYILFSGGSGRNGVVAEAKLMRDKAIELGVPKKAILLDVLSNNTSENILASLLVLERKFLLKNIKRLIIVSSPFHIRRISLTIGRYMPKWIKFSYCYDTNSKASLKNWQKTKKYYKIVEKEAKSIIYYAKNNYIDDIDITINTRKKKNSE